MKKLRISDELALPPDTVTSTIIAYGGKGMGKTVFGSVVAEELDACRLRWAWLDPLGVSYGMRYAANGKGKGVECLILGGVHGDIPITPQDGAAVADVVIEERCNVLIDFSRTAMGKMWGVGEKIRFCAAYARRLFERQGELVRGRKREPLMQILDEGARYVPQNIPAGNPHLSECVSAWQQLVEEGRNIGLGLLVLTQRSARLNKDIAELADAMFAFRTIGPNSLAAVLDWLGEHVEKSRIKELGDRTRKLPRGSALVVSPGWLDVEQVIAIRMRRTFDSSATPKPGERPRRARGPGAKPNIEKIRARMAAQIEQAKKDDPKELRRRLAELEKELRKRIPAEPTLKKSPSLEGRILLGEFEVVVDRRHLEETIKASEEFEKGLDEAKRKVRSMLEGTSVVMDGVTRLANITAKAARRARETGPAALAKRLAKAPAPTSRRPPSPPMKATEANREKDEWDRAARIVEASRSNGARSNGSDPSVGGSGLRRIMIALAQNPDGLARHTLAMRAGLSPRTGTYGTYLSRGRTEGWITPKDQDPIRITDDGLSALGHYDPLPTGDTLFEHWLREVGTDSGMGRMMRALKESYPNELTRDELAERANLSSETGTYGTYLSRLRGLKLIEGNKQMRLAVELVE